jgi:TolB-like protein
MARSTTFSSCRITSRPAAPSLSRNAGEGEPRRVSDAVGEGKPALSLPDKLSLAVLLFQNLTADAEQEYFVDGMVEEIITAIARLPWLFVIARNSSFGYKGRSPVLSRVGRELGSLRKAGNRVRITGQLIDTTTAPRPPGPRFARREDRLRRGKGEGDRDAVHPHRPRDILDLLLVEIVEGEVEPVAHLLVRYGTEAYPAGLGERFEPGCNVDAVAEHVAILDDDVTDIDAHAKFDAALVRYFGVAGDHLALHLDRAAHRVDDAGELGEGHRRSFWRCDPDARRFWDRPVHDEPHAMPRGCPLRPRPSAGNGR